MAKKGIGKFVAFAAITGAAVAAVSYFTRYKSFHKELEEDFHDFEDNDLSELDSTMNRNYVSLYADKDEFKVAASDMADAAKDMAGAAKNMVKDAAVIFSETASSVSETAKDLIKEKLEAGNQTKNSTTITEDFNDDDTF